METQAESFSSISKNHLLTNYSTGQLIPSCRAEALKAKREALRRKLNRVADQIYNLKYDTEYEVIQLKKLSKMGDNFFQTVQTLREKTKLDIDAAKMIREVQIHLNFDKMEVEKTQSTDRSTERSLITEKSFQEKKEEAIVISNSGIAQSKKQNERLTKSAVFQRPKHKSGSFSNVCQSKRIFFQSKTGPTENNEHFWNFCLFLLGLYIVVMIL